MKRLFLLLLLVSTLPAISYGQNTKTDEADFISYELRDLSSELKASDKQYLPFLNRTTLRTGLYHLEAGAVDPQQPHNLDEVYYVISGKASFTAGDQVAQVEEGSVLFVKAHVEHRFHDIEEDLQILVFFSAAEQ